MAVTPPKQGPVSPPGEDGHSGALSNKRRPKKYYISRRQTAPRSEKREGTLSHTGRQHQPPVSQRSEGKPRGRRSAARPPVGSPAGPDRPSRGLGEGRGERDHLPRATDVVARNVEVFFLFFFRLEQVTTSGPEIIKRGAHDETSVYCTTGRQRGPGARRNERSACSLSRVGLDVNVFLVCVLSSHPGESSQLLLADCVAAVSNAHPSQ